MSKLLSVVVPVYNTAEWLPRCLESLIQQTYRNLEIICVNDGSMDGSAVILDAYSAKDTRIKVIHQANAGVSAARNCGLDVATGEYVTFVDADDWLEPDSYEKAVPCMEDDVDLVCFGGLVDGDVESELKKNMQEYCCLKYSGKQIASARISHTDVYVWNKIFRKFLIDKYVISFPVGIACGEDAAFYFCYASVAKQAYYLPVYPYHYMQQRNSAMAEFRKRTPRGIDHLRVVDSLYDFYERNGLMHKMRGLYEGVFAGYYDLSLQYTSEEMHPEVHRMAYALAVKSGAIQANRLPQIRRLKGLRMSPMERLFHWYADNRECFGVCGRAICSITYEAEQVVYRIFGQMVKTVRMAERA